MKGPPPINYATHPNRATLTSGSSLARSVTQPASTQAPATPTPLSASCSGPFSTTVNPEWLESLICSMLMLPDEFFIQMAEGTAMNPPAALDGRDSNVNLLIVALDSLSSADTTLMPAAITVAAIAPIAVLPPPLPVLSPPVQHRHCRTKPKFYSVTVGRCCGVFQQWSYVKALVDGASGLCYTGFRGCQEAADDYAIAKAAGLVRVSRNPSDDALFGSLSTAIM